MKKIIDFFRPFLVSPFIIYIFDKMAVVIDVFIPLNVFTIMIVGLFNIFGLILLVIIYFIII